MKTNTADTSSAIDILFKYPEIFEDRKSIPDNCIYDILSYIQSEKIIVQKDQDSHDAFLIEEYVHLLCLLHLVVF